MNGNRNIYFDDKTLSKVDQFAEKHSMTRSCAVRFLINEQLQNNTI